MSALRYRAQLALLVAAPYHARVRGMDGEMAARVAAYEWLASQAPPLVSVHRASIGEPGEHARYTITDAGRAALGGAKAPTENSPRCSACGRFCSVAEKAPEGESGDIWECTRCDR